MQSEVRLKGNKRKRRLTGQKPIPRDETASVGSQKGHCSCGEGYAFKHDTNKKCKGKGRPRSLFRTGSPHWKSKGEGKGSDHGSGRDTHQNLLVKVRQGTRTNHLVQTSRKEIARGDFHAIIGMCPSVQNFQFQVDADSETSLHANTQLNLLMKRTIQHLLRFTFHRMVNDRCNFGKFSRMTRPQHRVRLHISRTNTFSEGNFWTCTWSHPDWTSTSAESERSNIRGKICRMDFGHGRKTRTSAWILHKNVYNIPGSYSENRERFFKPSSSPSITTSKERERERDVIYFADSGASLHLMSRKRFDSRRARNDSKAEGSITYYDCRWNYSYD